MASRLLLISVLSVSLASFAQVSAPPAQDNGNPAVPTAIPTTGTVWTGIAPAGGPLLSTPEASFASPLPTAGISDAGRAGISDSAPLNTGVPSTLGSATMVYLNVPENVVANGETVNPAMAAVSPERAHNDLLTSPSFSTIGAPASNGMSLGEIAALYRARQTAQNIRTYTNADVPRENAGNLTNILLAENKMPAPPQSAATTPSTPPARTRQATSAQTDASATAPQVPATQSENKSLPASASILPLLGLLGLVSTGIGLVVSGKRRT